MSKEFISVVIAAFNEEGNIRALTERSVSVLEHNFEYEIIYSIAGTDNTLRILQELQKKNKNIKIIYSEKPNGLGSDFKKGFNAVSKNADYVVTMDADLNHQPEEIPRLLDFANKFDIVIGSRAVDGSIRESIPFWKRIISDFTNSVFGIISGLKIKDKTSGFRVYKKNTIDTLSKKYTCNNFEFLLELLLIANKLNISMVEVPITFKYRIAGRSKFKFFKTGFGYLLLLFRN